MIMRASPPRDLAETVATLAVFQLALIQLLRAYASFLPTFDIYGALLGFLSSLIDQIWSVILDLGVVPDEAERPSADRR